MKKTIIASFFGLIMSLLPILKGESLSRILITFLATSLTMLFCLYIYGENKNKKRSNKVYPK
jgi:nucleoside recognition membrane protein YjiH